MTDQREVDRNQLLMGQSRLPGIHFENDRIGLIARILYRAWADPCHGFSGGHENRSLVIDAAT